ncbi:MAG: YkgJ family cysteine cluster protein [Planctomycetaceae bacterium]
MSGSQTPERELVTVRLQLTIGGERFALDVPVPTGPASPEDLLPFLRTLAKLVTDIGQEYAAGQGRSVSCRAGCGICCRQIVPVPEFEALRLARLVDSMPEPRRSNIRERFKDATKRLREAGLYDAVDSDHYLDAPPVLDLGPRYFRLMIACPFLEDESCSIYEDRPISCREYLVTSPAELCAEPDSNELDRVPLAIRPSTASMMLEVDQADDGPRQTRWMALTRALEWAASHTPREPSATGLQLLETLMKSLTGQPPSTAPGMNSSVT